MVIDKILNIDVVEQEFVNELQTLNDLYSGLHFLYSTVRPWELKIIENRPGKKIFFVGQPPEFIMDGIPQDLFTYLPSTFHWFSTSLINYARLCGFVVSRAQNIITPEDLNPPNRQKIKQACTDYVESIPELELVKKWRNKISGHFALTDPRSDDNIATLEESVRDPIGFSDFRFRTNLMISSKTMATETVDSELPTWALTETFELLTSRFWHLT